MGLLETRSPAGRAVYEEPGFVCPGAQARFGLTAHADSRAGTQEAYEYEHGLTPKRTLSTSKNLERNGFRSDFWAGGGLPRRSAVVT